MTLEEAIKHCEEKACSNTECACEHLQFAEWLKELQRLKSLPSNLDEAAEEFSDGEWDGLHDEDGMALYREDMIQYAFKAGAEWVYAQISNLPDNLDEAAISICADILEGETIIAEGYECVVLSDAEKCFKAGVKWRESQIPKLPYNLDEMAKRYESYYDVAEEHGYLNTHRGDIAEAFKDGAEWMARQGVSYNAVATRKYENSLHGFVSYLIGDEISAINKLIKQGEKMDVIVQIREAKEENK